MNDDDIGAALLRELPELHAAYIFGSRARGDANADSDFDIAVLLPARLEGMRRYDIQEKLAATLGHPVDLVDLLAASTVMRAQVLTDGKLLCDASPHARALFEMLALAQYARLNEERAGILKDIIERGSVYGR